jgi:hypothetical protein
VTERCVLLGPDITSATDGIGLRVHCQLTAIHPLLNRRAATHASRLMTRLADKVSAQNP